MVGGIRVHTLCIPNSPNLQEIIQVRQVLGRTEGVGGIRVHTLCIPTSPNLQEIIQVTGLRAY